MSDVGSIQRILAYLGEPAQAPCIAPAAPGLPWEEDFDPGAGTHLNEPLPEYELSSTSG